MPDYISDIDTLVPDGDINYVDQLDTIITDFKKKVRNSFPLVDVEVSVIPARFNQLVDNNFISVIRENGVEVAKLNGAFFTGPVYDPGIPPTQANQLANRQYVIDAIAAAIAAQIP